jgi:hypothetical protein
MSFAARSIADTAGGAPLEQPSLHLRGKGRVKGGPALQLLHQVISILFDVCSIAGAIGAAMRRADRDG